VKHKSFLQIAIDRIDTNYNARVNGHLSIQFWVYVEISLPSTLATTKLVERGAKALRWQTVRTGQKQQKPTLSCLAEKVGLQCLMLSPPTLAIGCDGGNDG